MNWLLKNFLRGLIIVVPIAITLYILPLGRAAGPLKLTVLILAVVFTVYTAYDYAVAAVRFVRESRAS